MVQIIQMFGSSLEIRKKFWAIHHILQVWVFITSSSSTTSKNQKLFSLFPLSHVGYMWFFFFFFERHVSSQVELPLRSLYSLIWWRVFGSASTNPTERSLVTRRSSCSFILHWKTNRSIHTSFNFSSNIYKNIDNNYSLTLFM